jgi:PIN domain nuclease of toxin-antitoxin system
VAQQLASTANELWLSPVSIWELILLVEKKRLALRQDFHVWIKESAQDLDLKEAAFSWEVAQELRFTMLGYADPADRFIAATAKAYDMTLVTADERLVKVPGLKVLANL